MIQAALTMGIAVLMQGAFARPQSAAPTIAKEAVAAERVAQVEYLYRTAVAEQKRVDDIAGRLFLANADLCPNARPRLGIEAASIDDIPEALQPAAAKIQGVSDRLTVIAVMGGSAADVAGVKAGDQILSIDGAPTAGGAKAAERFGRQAASALAANPTTVTLVIQRGAERLSVPIAPLRMCAYGVDVDGSEELNAYADGENIVITRPMLRLASTEAELALVLAHELAHNARGHIDAKKKNANTAGMGGLILDVIGAAAGVDTGGAFTEAAMRRGARVASPEFETEADYVGMYMLARAGYPLADVETFWRKMAVEAPSAIFIRSSHPATTDRYLTVAAARDEIEAKRAAGGPLVPNEKPKPAPKAKR